MIDFNSLEQSLPQAPFQHRWAIKPVRASTLCLDWWELHLIRRSSIHRIFDKSVGNAPVSGILLGPSIGMMTDAELEDSIQNAAREILRRRSETQRAEDRIAERDQAVGKSMLRWRR